MYGLILLVALSVIGVLLYFNVIDLGSYLPSTCDIGGSGDLKCEEYQFVGTNLQLGIRNIGQKPIDLLKIIVADSEDVHFTIPVTGFARVGSSLEEINPVAIPAGVLAPGAIAQVTLITGKPALAGQLFRGSITTTYRYKNGALENTAAGTMRVKVPK
jgi:hypothetical protein